MKAILALLFFTSLHLLGWSQPDSITSTHLKPFTGTVVYAVTVSGPDATAWQANFPDSLTIHFDTLGTRLTYHGGVLNGQEVLQISTGGIYYLRPDKRQFFRALKPSADSLIAAALDEWPTIAGISGISYSIQQAGNPRLLAKLVVADSLTIPSIPTGTGGYLTYFGVLLGRLPLALSVQAGYSPNIQLTLIAQRIQPGTFPQATFTVPAGYTEVRQDKYFTTEPY